jgi:hypothetical protein
MSNNMKAFFEFKTTYTDLEIIGSEINTTSKNGGSLSAPNTIKFLLDRVEEVFLFDDYSHFFPSIDIARQSEKKQRKSRTFSMVKILCTIIKMTDIKTLKIGSYNAARQWRNATIERISAFSGVSISNTKKIFGILEKSGIIETKQHINKKDLKLGSFKISIKKLSEDFIAALGLSDQLKTDRHFKNKEEAELSALEAALPSHAKLSLTPSAKLLKTAYRYVSKKFKDKQLR